MYSPKIKEEFVRKLYQLKQVEKKPITKLANEAIELYLQVKENSVTQLDGGKSERGKLSRTAA